MRRDLSGLTGWIALAAAALAGTVQAAEDDGAFRHRAPIVVETPGPFVRLPLPVSAHARSVQAGLGDLRVVDAQDRRVPFALLPPRADEVQRREQTREATLYPLPPRPAGDGVWASPVEVRVEGERIVVRRSGTGAKPPAPGGLPPGWLIDLGEGGPSAAGSRGVAEAPRPDHLRLRWSGPAEFSLGYALQTSEDLRTWRPAGGGQLLALAGPAGALTQPIVSLPAAVGRFVRLVWDDAALAPQLTGAAAVRTLPAAVVVDPPAELVLTPAADTTPADRADADARHALVVDLGAALPLVRLDVQPVAGTQVLPLRVQARTRADEPWQPLAAAVVYRLERDGEVRRSPPIAVPRRTVRYLRLVPDARAGVPEAAQWRVTAAVQLPSLVFTAQGQPPYALLAGAAKASAGALPVSTLVPALDDERPRFGKAVLGEWQEVPAVAQRIESEQRRAALRPWLLWAVIGVGVAGLGAMVWRLARQPRA